ncbi:MAG: hypothetical protein OXG74_20110 [Acidobacteria bacterium]|nr:hypothetical protein [Acidobacteriota bacterium]
MRLHIALDDELVAELDRRVGPRQRCAYIAHLIRLGLADDRRRWEDIESALGSIPDTGHDWDEDPAAWVRRQRGEDEHTRSCGPT